MLPRFRLLLLKFIFKVKLFKSTYEELVMQSKKTRFFKHLKKHPPPKIDFMLFNYFLQFKKIKIIFNNF